MASKKIGRQSFTLPNPPVISSWASSAGKKEREGPLGKYYDITCEDAYWGACTWEQAEKNMQQETLNKLEEKSGFPLKDLDLIFSGDLLNQCIGSSFTLRNTGIPHLGLYGACSTMAEGLLLASMAVGGGYADHAAAITSSHFASSERQYRFPLGYGGQRAPTAQWTVTGAGAVLLSESGTGPKVTGCTVGTVTDLGIKDSANMGAAMAPAALETLLAHFRDFSVSQDYYDMIVTGDLGQLGKELLQILALEQGLNLEEKLFDCGMLVFDNRYQDVHAGGSGCGCSAIALCSYLLNQIACHKLKRILFCGTGALLSPTSVQQKLPIPGICHAIVIEGD